eukprot:Selendium_serpulae@DN4641_c0_g1_i1.p1
MDDLLATGGFDSLIAQPDPSEDEELEVAEPEGVTERPDAVEEQQVVEAVAGGQISSRDYEEALVPVSDEIPTPRVQNIIASVHLGQELDLRRIALSARNAEYNPKKVNAVVMRLRDPKCTGLVFRTGRMMVTGSRNEVDARFGGKRMAKICQKAGHPDLRFHGFKVETMIATVDCKFPVRLEGLAYDQVHRQHCSYEPEMSPGLVYRYTTDAPDSKVCLLTFVSGKVIIMGCRTREEINSVFQRLYPVLCRYRKYSSIESSYEMQSTEEPPMLHAQ